MRDLWSNESVCRLCSEPIYPGQKAVAAPLGLKVGTPETLAERCEPYPRYHAACWDYAFPSLLPKRINDLECAVCRHPTADTWCVQIEDGTQPGRRYVTPCSRRIRLACHDRCFEWVWAHFYANAAVVAGDSRRAG